MSFQYVISFKIFYKKSDVLCFILKIFCPCYKRFQCHSISISMLNFFIILILISIHDFICMFSVQAFRHNKTLRVLF